MHQWGGAENFINVPLWIPGFFAVFLPFVIIFVLWSLVLKGLALWHAARRGEPVWFILLLLINTMGILELVYLFAVAKLKVNELFSKHVHHTHN